MALSLVLGITKKAFFQPIGPCVAGQGQIGSKARSTGGRCRQCRTGGRRRQHGRGALRPPTSGTHHLTKRTLARVVERTARAGKSVWLVGLARNRPSTARRHGPRAMATRMPSDSSPTAEDGDLSRNSYAAWIQLLTKWLLCQGSRPSPRRHRSSNRNPSASLRSGRRRDHVVQLAQRKRASTAARPRPSTPACFGYAPPHLADTGATHWRE